MLDIGFIHVHAMHNFVMKEYKKYFTSSDPHHDIYTL